MAISGIASHARRHLSPPNPGIAVHEGKRQIPHVDIGHRAVLAKPDTIADLACLRCDVQSCVIVAVGLIHLAITHPRAQFFVSSRRYLAGSHAEARFSRMIGGMIPCSHLPTTLLSLPHRLVGL
eukprot:2913136-Rhodomonas_salina.2